MACLMCGETVVKKNRRSISNRNRAVFEQLFTLAVTLFPPSSVQILLSHNSFLCPPCYRLPERLTALTNEGTELKNCILQRLERAGGSLGFIADKGERDPGATPARKRSGKETTAEPSRKRALDFGECSPSKKSPSVVVSCFIP